MREALFSSLGARVEAARVADLFAGTGAYGLEAMSRGAQSGLLVENSPRAVACLRKNLAEVAKSCEVPVSDWRILAQKCESLPPSLGPVDIIFIDPPYEIIQRDFSANFSKAIDALSCPHSLLCFEMPGNLNLDVPGWAESKRLGKVGKDKPTIALYQRAS
jgi:16S rRNA (guanine966-N2)-methyltransferase